MGILLLLLACLGSSVVHDASASIFRDNAPSLVCVPGAVFQYDHNPCYCNEEGSQLTCKRKMYSTLTPALNLRQLHNITYDCIPERYFKHDCRECICDVSGKYASCLISSNCNADDAAIETREKCIPGSVFKDYCNMCICSQDGEASCTNLDCPSLLSDTPNGVKCVPNSLFPFYCNDCECNSDGTSVECNNMGCSSPNINHEHLLNVTLTCEAETVFDHNCHECFCSDTGDYAMCYGKPCPHRDDFKEVENTADQCDPGMIYANDCNICVCNSERKRVCTTLSCDASYRFKYVDVLNFARPLQ